MIEKKRLEELIEQGATIYSTDTKLYGLVKWLELENKLEKLEFNKDGEVKLFIIDNGWWHWFYLKDLYEDLEEVEWHKEFGCIERTERLELPTWEEICDGANYYKQFTKKGSTYGIALNIVDERILLDGCYNIPLTKENYTLACRKAKELFLGEKK